MKTLIVTTLFAATAGSLLAADGKADLEAAAKKLGDKANYSWTAKTESSGPAEGDRDGKTEKGGYSVLNFAMRDTQGQAVFIEDFTVFGAQRRAALAAGKIVMIVG